MSLRIDNARLFTAVPNQPPLPRGSLFCDGGSIVSITAPGEALPEPARRAATVIDAAGRVLLPGFVDVHTHAIWAGDRLDEFVAKQRGASYLELLAAGGGILATVRATRAASTETLEEGLLQRLGRLLREGTTTVEVKSGYGLSTRDELRLLEAITRAAGRAPLAVVPTALLGHALDPAEPDFVGTTVNETLPAVSAAFPGIAVDAYCEQGAWSVADCERLFDRALALGHPVRVHADQFHALGMVERAIARRARSVDHLEATAPESLRRLAASGTFGVMLPASGFCTDDRYANARAFVDAGGKLALGSNFNPGSSPTCSMPFVVALATRKLRLSPEEAIVAATRTAAQLLGLADRGVLAPGKRADLILVCHRDERALGYEVGGNPVDLVVVNGRPVGTAAS